jgi:hypothetical protein
MVYLKKWLRLLCKVFFIRKYIKILFFYILKIIFDIITSKWSENTKNNINLKSYGVFEKVVAVAL